jgi:hypothetical protein
MADKKKYRVIRKEISTTEYEVDAWNPAHAREVEAPPTQNEPVRETVFRVKLVKPQEESARDGATSDEEQLPEKPEKSARKKKRENE